MPFACIYVPNFPVAAALWAEPELRACAVAILENRPPLETIIAVNENAGCMGIVPGMTKAQAELCTELVLHPRSALQESAAHAALLGCAQSFSPCVEDTASGTVVLDLAGMETLFGSPPEIARAICDRASRLGLDANIAVASNPDAAVLAARGFSGVTVIPADRETEHLGTLPVEVLFADRLKGDQKEEANRMLETLDRWGIRDLHALAALPEVALSERLGQEGLRLQRLARGAAWRTLVAVETPLVFEEAVELEYPVVLLEPLAFLLNRLLEQLCARLAAHALATQELRLTLELENYSLLNQPSTINNQQSVLQSAIGNRQPEIESRGEQFCRILRLPLPMLDVKVFLKLLQLDLQAHPPGAPIVKIHLAAEPARPRSAQGGLFLPPLPEPEKLELTLARIASLVGDQKVGALELLDTHHSEGFRMRHFSAEASRKRLPEKAFDAPEETSAVTALRRFRPRLRVNVILENGQPVRVSCAKKKAVQGDVLWKAGPWRSSGDWWEREAWSRDEWDVALQSAESIALYRLVRDLLGGGWFVEGTYD